MPRYRVDLLEEAEADARSLYLWIYENSPTAAERFAETLEAKIAELGESAHAWDAKHDIKRLYINRYRVTLVYRLRGELVMIGAVAHQRQKPGFWLKRDF